MPVPANLIVQMALTAAEIAEREAKNCEEFVRKLDSIIKQAWEAEQECRTNLPADIPTPVPSGK